MSKANHNPLGIGNKLPSKKQALESIRRDEFLGGLGRGKSLIEIQSEEDAMEIPYPDCFRTMEFDMKSNICKNCEFNKRCKK
jgi:hypothetical protein